MNKNLIDIKNNHNRLSGHEKYIHQDDNLDKIILGTSLKTLDQKENFLTSDQKLLEQTTHEPTPYYFISTFLKFIQPTENDVIYDLGSGYGRVVLFGAMISNARFIGVEIVKDRAIFAKKRAKELELNNASFLQQNVKNIDLSQGDIFFFFNPFLEPTLHNVGQKLKRVSSRKEIKIACWGGLGIFNYFNNEEWLTQIYPPEDLRISKLSYFCSL